MSRSLLYLVNSQSQSVADGGVINFGTPVRRFGCNINGSNGNVVTRGQGYYDGSINLSFVAGGTGNIKVTLYENGVEIPGANSTKSVTASYTYDLSFPFAVKDNCGCDKTITAVVSGVAAEFNNAAILTVKE